MATESLLSCDIPQVLPPELRPNVEHLVTEDDTPVDNIFSEKQQRLLTEPLYSSPEWAGTGRPFVALANVGLFYAIREPPFVPDMLLSLDVQVPDDLWPKSHRSYFIWEYGKPPNVVIEVVSNRKGGEDTTKLKKYAHLGIGYYVVFDPQEMLSDQPLRAFRLVANQYAPFDESLWFPDVGLGLRLWEGRFEGHPDTWLRWRDQAGEPIPTGAERAQRELHRANREHRRANQERNRADQERKRAEQEQNRADQERQRAERLAEQLRQLGVEPGD